MSTSILDQTDEFGNTLPAEPCYDHDAAWWAQQTAEDRQRDLDEQALQDFEDWVQAMEDLARQMPGVLPSGPVTDQDLYPGRVG